MDIDREYLQATLANLRQQEREATVLAHRSRGAILLCEALIARQDETEQAQTPQAPAQVLEFEKK
jgi:esterase/lipase superfamily enzyme